jgi:hypothetical protein
MFTTEVDKFMDAFNMLVKELQVISEKLENIDRHLVELVDRD